MPEDTEDIITTDIRNAVTWQYPQMFVNVMPKGGDLVQIGPWTRDRFEKED